MVESVEGLVSSFEQLEAPRERNIQKAQRESNIQIDTEEPVPDNFPFEIVDEEGMSVVILKRDYKDEKIEVIVSMPNLEGGPEYDDEDGEGNDEDAGKDDEDEGAGDSSVSLKVTVSKGSGPILEFPVNVQKGLFKFLEQRGITLPTTNFMHDYMVTKQTEEYVRWMTKLKDFVRQ